MVESDEGRNREQSRQRKPEKKNKVPDQNKRLNVLFIHPDLGIGGAERLVVDAGLGLKSRGHHVHFLTSHHDPSHSFPETNDGTLGVTVVGDWFPRSIFGRCYALCAYIRMVISCLYFLLPCFSSSKHFHGLEDTPDLLFVDQISACIPFLRLKKNLPVVFYCHFPDLLLASHNCLSRRVYRYPLDKLEEWSTGLAHCILVNSQFTSGVFRSTFKGLKECQLDIVYPTLNTKAFSGPSSPFPSDLLPSRAKHIFLSINRYERKKNIALAIRALGLLRGKISSALFQESHLVVVGGYDTRVPENVDHFAELTSLADRLQLTSHVTFLRSPSDSAKRALIEKCDVLIYTPDKEHFGIVPLEAMYCHKPVIAVNSGGPLETVENKRSGLLVPPSPEEFADAMAFFRQYPDKITEFGNYGRECVEKRFTFNSFAEKLDSICSELA